MSANVVGTIQEIERIEDPKDNEKVFYRIKLSPKPSYDFIEKVYDCWNELVRIQSLNHAELLTDYQGNLLIHTSAHEDSNHLIRLMENAISSINHRQSSSLE